MASTSETGHAKNIANFRSLHDSVVSFGAGYAPFDDKLKPDALNSQYRSAVTAQDVLKTADEAYHRQVSARAGVYRPLSVVVTRALAIFMVSKAGQSVKDHAKTLADVIRGANTAAPAPPGGTVASTEEKRRSVSQQSFVMKADKFDAFIKVLKAEPTYQPGNDALKTTALESLLSSLVNASAPTDEALKVWKRLLATRNEILYAPETSMVEVAFQVKTYVKGDFGTSSNEYKEIKGLRFSRKPD